MTPAVSVIVPNWNGAGRLPALFACLRLQEGVQETIVVDNGSTDESLRVAREAGVRVIGLPSNRGFAAAVNQGIRAAVCEWLFIVNNDVELRPDWLRVASRAAIAQGASFATGKLLDAGQHDRIDGTFDAVSRGGTAYRCGAGRPDGPKFNAERPIDLAPFTALLLRKDVAEAVGPLDESFESYLEDIDFGLRCAARGIRGVYVPAAAGYHAGSATLGRWHPETVRRLARNQVLLVAKHYPLDGPRSIWAVVVAQALWGLVALRHGAGAAWLRGKGEGLRRFRLVRRVTAARPDLTPVLARSEREIYAIQAAAGFDLYWRLYFLLT